INENNFITLTFEDNEYLPESEVKSILDYRRKGFFNINLPLELLFKDNNIKNKYWANKWRVYGLGLVGSLDGVVFTNYKIIEDITDHATYITTRVDFIHTNDPSTIVNKYKIDNFPIYDEALYQTGIVNSQLPKEIKSFNRNVIADSAEPKSI